MRFGSSFHAIAAVSMGVAALALGLAVAWCGRFDPPPADAGPRPPQDLPKGDVEWRELRVTGYCNCGRCCSWRRSWFGFGRPVVSNGRNAGRDKAVGVAANGRPAKLGTIAADVKLFPFGTRLFVPGYGLGTVGDTGGAVVGEHIDLWFPTHEEARRWGSRRLKVGIVRQGEKQ